MSEAHDLGTFIRDSPDPIPQPPPDPPRQKLTFRSSKIIYYGPHACGNCGATICKMGREWGGNAFDYPEGPIYPNTEWHPHICDPIDVRRHNDLKGIPAPTHADSRHWQGQTYTGPEPGIKNILE